MPRKRKSEVPTGEPINFYELSDVQAFTTKSHNPYYSIHNIKVPFRMCIIGGSGSMKTNCVLNIFKTINETFNYVELFCRNSDEPLYNYLKTRIDPTMLKVYDGLKELNSRDIDKFYKDKGQTCVVFDDLCLEKDASKIEELYIRGRKIGGGISLIYLSQKYFKIPTPVRGQTGYYILKKISGKGDLMRILAENSLSASKEQLLNMYKYCIAGNPASFLLIDLEAPQEQTYRKNFLEYLNPDDFE